MKTVVEPAETVEVISTVTSGYFRLLLQLQRPPPCSLSEPDLEGMIALVKEICKSVKAQEYDLLMTAEFASCRGWASVPTSEEGCEDRALVVTNRGVVLVEWGMRDEIQAWASLPLVLGPASQ